MYNPLQHPYPETDYTLIVPNDNHELADELTRLAGHINAANYRFLKLLAVLILGLTIYSKVSWARRTW